MLGKWIFCLVLSGLVASAGWALGYRAGYGRADAIRQVEVAGLQVQLETWKAAQAQAWADAERKAREELEAAQVRVNTLVVKLDQTKKENAAKVRDITRRIPHATAGNTCTFGPEFVRLYNEAIGLSPDRAGDGAVPQAGGAGGAAGTPGTASASGAAVRRDAVTPADILGHIRDYGARSQAMEAQLGALIDLVGDGKGAK